ncbi:MAG: hypothetical protein ACHBN1_04240 [Heteroscytonema crispum UTEX LB 1556]
MNIHLLLALCDKGLPECTNINKAIFVGWGAIAQRFAVLPTIELNADFFVGGQCPPYCS